MEELIFRAGHDLRSPIRSIQGYVDILTTDHREALGTGELELLARVDASCKEMSDILDSLLKYTVIPSKRPNLGRVEISELFERAVHELKLQARGVAVDLKASSNIQADPTMLQDLAAALLSNAEKALKDRPNPLLTIRDEVRDEEVMVTVEDNGIGFDQRYAEQALLPFEKLHSKRVFPGSGLGLAVANVIAEMHGGRLWLESREGVGTKATFAVPKGI